MGVVSAALRMFGYDATEDKKRRKPPTVSLMSEDNQLNQTDRRKLISTTRDIHRNYEVAAWMIRQHLNYVSSFSFQAKTGNTQLDEQIEALITAWSRPDNFDAAGRHGRRRFVRLAEARRTLDGDFGALKLDDRGRRLTGKVQAIEGDRLRTPTLGGLPAGIDPNRLVHGVQIDGAGKAMAYALCNRNPIGDGFTFSRMVPAANLQMLGYYDRFDQVRGISPVACAINRLRDTYEAFDYALAKAKVAQLFALAIYSDLADANGEVYTSDGGTDADEDGEADEGTEKYQVDLGRGPIKMELQPGDKAEFLESKTPSTEFRTYGEFAIAVALLSLDLPFTYFDVTKANFAAARLQIWQYEQSAKHKRDDLRDWLDALTYWRLQLAVRDGQLELPAGWTVADLLGLWEWVHGGIPWIQKLSDIKADAVAVDRGFSSTVRICKEQQVDAYALVDEEAEYQAYRKTKLGPYLPAPAAKPAAPTEPVEPKA